jgi:hypothetical protein
MTGNLLSPSRGLFIYSPVLLLSIPGAIYALRNKNLRPLGTVTTLSIVCHWVLISTFPHWWADHSYGPRFFSDVIPLLCLLLIFFFESISVHRRRNVTLWLLGALPLILFGVYANYKGACSIETWHWNTRPTDVDTHPDRLWDWHDWQMFR